MPIYNNLIPQPNDNPSQSQDQILENFEVLAIAFAQDHSAYNSPTQGQHKQITFPVWPLVGQPFTYLAGQIGLQNITAVPSSRPDIWLSRGTSAPYPMTGYSNGAVSANNATSWTYFASGELRIGGMATTSAGTLTITFNNTGSGGLASFPGFSNFISDIQVSTINAGATAVSVKITSFTLTSVTFGLINGSVDSSFFWSATGL